MSEMPESVSRSEAAGRQIQDSVRAINYGTPVPLDLDGVVEKLLFYFTILYTGPSWGGDTRTSEGWHQKKEALRLMFRSRLAPTFEAHEAIRVAEVESLTAECDALQRELGKMRAANVVYRGRGDTREIDEPREEIERLNKTVEALTNDNARLLLQINQMGEARR